MEERRISELIKAKSVDHIDSSMTVMDAVRYMAQVRRGAVPVIDGDGLVGMFSERDLMLRVVLAGKDPENTKVADVMTRDLVVAPADSTHAECLAKMLKMHFRHLPVVDGDRLIGLISVRDLMESEADRKEQEINMLNYYVHYNPSN